MTAGLCGLKVGNGAPCRFVAEISNNHNGDLERLKVLVAYAKDAGCDAVKFQAFAVDELCGMRGEGPASAPWDHLTVRELYTRAQTPLAWFPEIAAYCNAVGIPWFSSVFGRESLDMLERVSCKAYKLARLDNQDASLAAMVKATGKPVIVSTAGEAPAIENPDLVLWCPKNYPQTDFGFRPDLFREYEGFSYHGTDPAPCIEAAGLGASLIEAHFQLDDEPSELEANVSLTASAFKRMVESVRRCES